MKCSIQIYLELEFCIVQTLPMICVRVDDDIVAQGPQQRNLQININQDLDAGTHRLSVDFVNKNYKESTAINDMAVIINQVRFQHLDNDFKIYSLYCPVYPEPWLSQQVVTPAAVVHGNYMGWNGHWYLEFETPIYRWIHQRLNLGWLL